MAVDRSLGVETFGGRERPHERYRLPPDTQRILRRVLGGARRGDGPAIDVPSNFGSMCERLAAASARYEPEQSEQEIRLATAPARRRESETVHCSASHAAVDIRQLFPQERWCNDLTHRGNRDRAAVRSAFRALVRMVHTPQWHHHYVLAALYGDMPPGLPARGLWGESVDEEYRRVARLTAAYGRTLVEFEAATHRKLAPMLQRTLLLTRVANEAEALITRASRAFEASVAVL
jgi:hypothetical protein